MNLGFLWVLLLLFIYFANLAAQISRYQRLLNGFLTFFLGAMFTLNILVLLRWVQADDLPRTPIITALAVWTIVTVLLLMTLALVHYPSLRLRLRHALPPAVGYNPDSILHTTAIVIAVISLSLEFHTFIFIGGISGVVEELQGGFEPINLWSQVAFYLSVALLGVGLFSRRAWRQVLVRLGLTSFSLNDIKQGVGMGIAMYGLMIALNIVGTIFFPQSPEIAYDEILPMTTPESILSFGLLIALTAAISEEILYRGALQPVFGITLTSLFFALSHLQYTFTWASVIIFFVSLGFGYVRQHTSTTAAIIAHFVYNFVPFLLLASLS